MRFSVYSHRSNPAIDPPLCRKKPAYVESLITGHAADWIDSADHSKGILLRGKLMPEGPNHEAMIAGGGFDTAWSLRPSGYAGPLVWQLNTTRSFANA